LVVRLTFRIAAVVFGVAVALFRIVGFPNFAAFAHLARVPGFAVVPGRRPGAGQR